MKFRILLATCMTVGLLASADEATTPQQPTSPPPAPAQPTPPEPKPVVQKLRVLVIGDSNTEIGFIVGGLAKAMEQAYGFHGTGYHSLVDDVGMGRAGCYLPYLTIADVGSWKKNYMCPQDDKLAFLSPDGTCINASTPDAHVDVSFYGKSVDVYWLGNPKGGQFTLSLDGQEQTVDTNDATTETRSTVVPNLPAAWHKLVLTVKEGDVTLLGVDPEVTPKDTPAAVANKWGRSYAETRHYASMPEMTQNSALKLLRPDTIFIMLGTNDAALRGTTCTGYLDNLVTMVTRIKTALPSARVIILSTLPTTSSVKLLNSYRPLLPALAKSLGVEYFDLFDWLGDDPKALEDKLLMVPREPHLNAIGGDMVGTELLKLAQSPLPPAPSAPEPPKKIDDTGTDRPPLSKFVTLWLAGDGPMEVDANNGIAAWDGLRNGLGASQLMPEYRPQLIPNAINGKPAVRFDGKSSFFFLHNANVNGFVLVWKARSANGGLFDQGQLGNRFGPGLLGSDKLIDQTVAKVQGNFFVNGKPTAVGDVGYPIGGWQVLSYLGQGPAIRGLGENEYYFGYGASPDKQGRAMLDADVAELIGFNTNDDKAIEEAEQYVAKKYGVDVTPR